MQGKSRHPPPTEHRGPAIPGHVEIPPQERGEKAMARIINGNLKSIRDFLNRRFSVIEEQFADVDAALRKLNQKETLEMAAIDDVRTSVAVLRQNDTDIKQGIANLVTRLGDNPTEAELGVIATELAALGASGAEVKPALDALDPDVPGGPINPDTELPG